MKSSSSNRSPKEQYLFVIEIFCNVISDRFNATNLTLTFWTW